MFYKKNKGFQQQLETLCSLCTTSYLMWDWFKYLDAPLEIIFDQAAFCTQAEQQRQEGGQEYDAAADPLPAVQPLTQHGKTGDQAPDRVEGVDQPGPGGRYVALVDVLEGEAEHSREHGAVDNRQHGGGGDAERGEREQQRGGSGNQRYRGELDERDQENVVILQDLGDRDDVAGDQESAERREKIAAVEPATAAGCQQHDPAHREGDTCHVYPPDTVVPGHFGDHWYEEHEEVVENAGPRDAGSLDAEDETEVGQPQSDPYSHAADDGTGVKLFKASGTDQQHDGCRQDEPGKNKQLRRDRGDTNFAEQKTPSPEEGSQYQKKIYPVHGRGCRCCCHRGPFETTTALAMYSWITGRSAAAQSSSGMKRDSIHLRSWCSYGVMAPPVRRQVKG